MAYTLTLSEGSTSIDLMYSATTGWSLLAGGLKVSRPEERLIYGGRLEDKLVRRDHGKRTIPLELTVEGSTGEDLIDRVNALQEMLDHAVRYHTDGWGDPVYLTVKIDDATYAVRFPVLHGEIETDKLYELGREEADTLDSVPVVLTCEAYWESDTLYSLENYVYNPGFWRGAVAPGDSWTEVDPAAKLGLTWATAAANWEVMGRALSWDIQHDAVNDVGIRSDNITVTAATNYYFECRGRHRVDCDRITARVYNVTGGAVIAASVLQFDNQDGQYEKLGAAFATPAGCVSVCIEMFRLVADSTAFPANKEFDCDAFYLGTGTTAPVGWSSGRNLVNHLDADADHLNVLCVTEIPGEVEAEVKYTITLDDNTDIMRVAKRTKDTPANYIWELNAVNAVVTAGDANCIDSALAGDGTAPGGQRVTVSFAGTQTMALRCYWDVTTDLASYYGKLVFLVIAKMSGATNIAKMKIYCQDETAWQLGQTLRSISGTSWTLYDGWEAFSFRIGTHDNDLFGTGNNWRIELLAETNGAPGDALHIACAFLVPVEEAYLIAGGAGSFAGGSSQMILKNMDGDRGMFAYGTVSDTYYPNLGGTGTTPLLTPEVENWLYFVSGGTYVLDDAWHVALQYRPRGKFLRGINP